jgi:hypothetical protein
MRWPVFLIAAYVAIALDEGLGLALSIPDATGVRPRFALILAVFVALAAPGLTAAWAALLLGVLVDLTTPVLTGAGRSAVLVGPWALGFFVGAYVGLQLRGLVFRDSPLTLAVMVLVVGAFVHLVATAVLWARGFSWLLGEPLGADWSASGQLVHGFFELIYTALAAVPVGWLLFRTEPLWAFQPAKGLGARGR